jgi:uncharacterized protein (DUF342 family)
MSATYRVQVTGDGLKAYAVSCLSSDEQGVSPGELIWELRRLRVRAGIEEQAISQLVSGAGLPAGERVLLAEGTAPVRGRDGYVEVLVDVSGERRYQEAEDGSLDFRETNLIKCVESGQEIARVHPPTAGAMGRSVRNEAIRPQPGRPAKFKLGPGVTLIEGGTKVVAAVAGQPRVNGSLLWIDQVLSVGGDVDYETGNIRFKGTVRVSGSVLDGFEVQAEKNIEISGTVGACSLKAGGDIVVNAGVTGRGKARLEAGGEIRARYFNEAEVRAAGDVEFASEVVGGLVLSKGRVSSERGAVMGGRCVALKGISVGVLGSDLGVPTEVVFGQDFEVLERMEAIAAELGSLEKPLEKLGKRLDKFSDRRAFLALAPAERQQVKEAFERFKQLKTRREQLLAERVSLGQSVRELTAGTSLRVRGRVHADVVVRGPHGSFENREGRSGPVEFVEGSDGRLMVRSDSAVRSVS